MTQKPTNKELLKKRHKLFISIFIISILFIFYIIAAGYSLYRKDLKSEQSRMYLLESQLKEQTVSFFSNYLSLFVMLSEVQAIQVKNTEKLNDLFFRLNHRFSEFENIAAVDEKGFFFASGKPFDLSNPPNISKLLFFQKIKNGDEFVIMEPHVGPISHQKVTGIVVRLEDENHLFTGLLGTSIKLSHLTDKWVKFAEKNNIKLFCYRGNKDIIFSEGIDELKLNSFFSDSTINKKFKIDKKQYLYTTISILELDSKVVLLSENYISFLDEFISSPLHIVISVLFLITIIFLVFLYRKEITWLKLLLQSETLLNATQKISKVGGWEWDVEKQTMFWTDEVYQIHDFQLSDFSSGAIKHIERSIECYDPENRSVIMEAFRNCAEKGHPYDFEFPFTKVTGDRIWVRTKAEPVMDGKRIIKVMGNIIDITERKQAEEALKKSEEKYRTIMESMKDATYITSTEFRIEYMNPTMIDRVGTDATGEICHKAIYERDEKCPWCVLDQVKKGEKVDYEVADPKDSRYYSVSNSLILHADSAVSKLTIFHDITQIKNIEAQLQQSRKMESIGTLAGGIAHDFNNLLYMISGNAELALEDIPKWNPVHTNLEEIKSASLRAAGIVKQLLNFSRKTDQKLEPIGAVTVIKDALKFLRSTIPTTIDIRKHLPEEDVTILADPVQINQVLMNLCINASQAMEDTGGILEIIVENVSLDEEAADSYPDLTAGDYLKITVSDTGPGIAPGSISRIFDPYFTTKEMGKGSGMGLSIVHGIVKNHDGAISVISKPGKGTTFSLLFPIVDEKPKIETETIDEIPRGNETILFVDDEEAITDMTGQMLKRLGYRVETRLNPVEALELFKSKPDIFDLVITDMTMPQMTGAKLSEKLMEIRSDIPVIICTGHSSLINEKNAKQLGIAGFVMKPTSMSKIAKAIRKVLDK